MSVTITHARSLLGRLSPHFKTIAIVGTVAGIAIALYGQRRALANFDWDLDWPAFVLSVFLFAVAPVVQGIAFWMVLRMLGLTSRFDEALVIWMRSFLLRYAPSGALALVIRVKERERLDAEEGDIYASFGYEQLVALASGALACFLGFVLAGSRPPLLAVVVCAAILAVSVAVRPAFLGRFVQRKLAERGMKLSRLLRGRYFLLVVLANAVGWLATGAATWTLIASLTEKPVPSVSWLTGVYAFAFLLGFLVPILPGGLGLRDATLIGFLAAPFGAGVATALGLTLRLANTLGEFVAIAAVEGLYRLRAAAEPARAFVFELRRGH